ncbi:hypothetical protein KOW79_001261 [Hemibagrus wyckioides]|uniref:Uncharacterized protein n=1 Tax=Hemibagrus wyckioides TaxID=337641 RepID=A0A9D3P7V2_9TELE|nr:hypothetical protein KOW79_001261 [Hemibagrus wyckioides]
MAAWTDRRHRLQPRETDFCRILLLQIWATWSSRRRGRQMITAGWKPTCGHQRLMDDLMEVKGRHPLTLCPQPSTRDHPVLIRRVSAVFLLHRRSRLITAATPPGFLGEPELIRLFSTNFLCHAAIDRRAPPLTRFNLLLSESSVSRLRLRGFCADAAFGALMDCRVLGSNIAERPLREKKQLVLRGSKSRLSFSPLVAVFSSHAPFLLPDR